MSIFPAFASIFAFFLTNEESVGLGKVELYIFLVEGQAEVRTRMYEMRGVDAE